VRLNPFPEAQIFIALLFAQPPDLDQIGDHIDHDTIGWWPIVSIFPAGFGVSAKRICCGILKSCSFCFHFRAWTHAG
jgi:hypothetical protein